ncbi:MAG: AAA family ATPase [Gammaproteobacteria bacterium]|nr:AAA family ATPase [Gammaproteobacteria bacterium]
MYIRNINQSLIEWSQKKGRMPLVLRGARQIGKTTVVDHFGKQHYSHFLKLNLEIKADRDLFEQNYSITDLISAIHFHLKKPIQNKGVTLLFIDEIQSCPLAANYLRYFYEERNDIHVIAAGSLLETLIDKHISFPVGRVEYFFMHPFSFSEYLLAADENEAYEMIKEIPCPDFSHTKLLELFHQYTLVGGMPAAIKAYLADKDILASNQIYENLTIAFMDDVEKYASNKSMAQVIRHAIAHAPLASGMRIHFHGFGNSNYKSREMGEALRTLEKAMLLKLIYPTTQATPPAEIDHKKSPRLQFLDIGMANHAAGLQQYFFNVKDLNTIYLGRIVESVVGQELLTINPHHHQPLKFWVREKAQSQAEVDYIMPFEKYLIPIEVKSGKTGQLKSLLQFMEIANHDFAIRLYAGKIKLDELKTPSGKSFRLLNLPYYLTSQLNYYVKQFF